MTKKGEALSVSPFSKHSSKRGLFFSAFLTNEVSSTESGQHGDAGTQRGVSIFIATVARKARSSNTSASNFFLTRSVASLEEAATVSKCSHA